VANITRIREPGEDDVPGELPFDAVPLSRFLQWECPPLGWIVPGLVPARGVTLMLSAPNAGKTLLAFDYAAQAAAAGRKVLILEEEGSARGCQERLRRAGAAAGLEGAKWDNIEVAWNSGFALLNVAHQNYLIASVQERKIELVVMDSLSAVCRGVDENDAAQMALVAEGLYRTSATPGCAVLGLHHMTKEAWKPGQTPTLASGRGHGVLMGRIDAALALVPIECDPQSVRFELYTLKMREAERLPPRQMQVRMHGPAAIVDDFRLDAAPRRSPASQRLADAMVAVLPLVPVGEENAVSQNAIVDKLGQHKQTVISAVRELLFKSAIKQLGNGRVYRMKGTVARQIPSDSGRYSRYGRTDRESDD
jgi:hypothetical protein